MMVRISRSRIDLENARLDNGVFKNWGETLVGGASGSYTGASYTIDLSAGNVFNLFLNTNCAFTFSNPTGSGAICSFTLILHQDATGSRVATWPTAVVWPYAPDVSVLSTTANAINVLSFVTYDGGLTWLGLVAAAGYGGGAGPTGPNFFGYFGGGNNGSNASTVDRIDYSNDTATAVVKTSLSLARDLLAATGTSSFGYFGGGLAATAVTTVDRIDYSNDTATAVAKGPLSAVCYGLGATGNSSFGYFGGGTPTFAGVSIVDRIDYSSDTSTAAVKGPLSGAHYLLAATGTSSFGYFGGGQSAPVATTISIVDRINYSSDTFTAVAKGPLSLARYRLAATGTSSFGYFGGGLAATAVTTVDRIDYSNDTATAVAKGPLTLPRYLLAAAGTSTFGYFGGGFFTPTFYSSIDRIDYSSDTSTTAAEGPLSGVRSSQAGVQHFAIS